MANEPIFRIAFTVLFLSSIAISVYYRRQARKQSAQISRAEERKSLLLLRLFFALPLYGAMFAYIINPVWMQWAHIRLPEWLRWLGMVVGVSVLPLLHALFRHLGKNISETVLTKASQELVVSGPYRCIRHPLYTAATAVLLALSLIAANAFMAVMVLLVAALLPVLVAREERHLQEKFGERYRAYMKQTGRFLPRLHGSKP